MRPMIDLHCHLDGSLPLPVVRRLAERGGIPLPEEDTALASLLRAPRTCGSLEEYLTCFEVPVACLQTEENLHQGSYSVARQAAREGVIYLELRFAPLLHVNNGLRLREVIGAVTAGFAEAQAEMELEGGVILCAMRHHSVEDNLDMLREGAAYFGRGVCGLDLAGAEAQYPPELQRRLFTEAKQMGLPITIHAGECGCAANVRTAMELGAERVGHGVALIRDPQIMQEWVAYGGCLELCPTSNRQTRAVQPEEVYPLQQLWEAGVVLTVNTDNRTVSDTTLSEELDYLKRNCGLSFEQQRTLMLHAAAHAFTTQDVKEDLRRRLLAGWS